MIRIAATTLALVLGAAASTVGAQPVTTAPDSAFTAFMRTQGFAAWTVVQAQAGNRGPAYPAAMRAAGTAGVVLASVIVDTLGRADLRSFRALLATDPAFVEAVRSSLEAMQFVPAQVNGRLVKQLVQIPFAFSLAGGAPAPLGELETAARTTRCGQSGSCPVHRLGTVTITAGR